MPVEHPSEWMQMKHSDFPSLSLNGGSPSFAPAFALMDYFGTTDALMAPPID